MALMFLTGVAIFAYPFYADALNNYLDQRRIAHFQEQMRDADQQNRQKHRQTAKANQQTGLAASEIAALADTPASSKDSVDYAKHMLGAIYIPDINVSLPLFDETNNQLLEQGAALLQGTSLPGAKDHHAVITGHSGLPNKKLFTDLEQLNKGDIFYLERFGETLAYEIFSIKVILPTQLDDLRIQIGEDLVTLLTCTPYAVNSHRLLVTGRRTDYQADHMRQAVNQAKAYHRERLIWLIAGAVFFLGLFVWWVRSRIKKFQRKQ